MKIALDFDQTFTEDPKMWRKFIDLVELNDHEIMIVTFRDPSIPVEYDFDIPVFYTSYQAKREFMAEVKGIEIDVWIDDSPDTILHGSSWTPQQREDWKLEHFNKLAEKQRAV